jgi:hypothetical protein
VITRKLRHLVLALALLLLAPFLAWAPSTSAQSQIPLTSSSDVFYSTGVAVTVTSATATTLITLNVPQGLMAPSVHCRLTGVVTTAAAPGTATFGVVYGTSAAVNAPSAQTLTASMTNQPGSSTSSCSRPPECRPRNCRCG